MISELVNNDSYLMCAPHSKLFFGGWMLQVPRLADLIAYRQRKETLIKRVDSFLVETEGGTAQAHAYSLPWDPMQHLAVVFGDIRDGVDVPVRLHPENVAKDVFGSGAVLSGIMKDMGKAERGVIVYLREGSVGVGQQIRNRPGEGEAHAEAKARENEWREIGLGAQILKDLGVSSIRLVASRERHYVGLEGFGITISTTEII